MKGFSAPQRRAVYAMTSGHCFYCGIPLAPDRGGMIEAHARDWLVPASRPTMSIDHCLPAQRGGADDIENLKPSCGSCNSEKSLSTVDEYRFRLALMNGALPHRFAHDPVPRVQRDFIVVVSAHARRAMIVHNFPNAYGHRSYR